MHFTGFRRNCEHIFATTPGATLMRAMMYIETGYPYNWANIDTSCLREETSNLRRINRVHWWD